MNYQKDRERLLNWLRRQIIGPAYKEKLLQGIAPLNRYPSGVLYPVMLGELGIDPAFEGEVEDDAPEVEDEEETAEPSIKPSRYIPPSSVGFSFYVQSEWVKFQTICSAVQYKHTGERDVQGQYRAHEYKPTVLGGDTEAQTFKSPMASQNRKQYSERRDALGSGAGIEALWRPFSDGWIVTVSLFNKQGSNTDPVQRNEKALFAVELRCVLEVGKVATYPRVDKSLLSEEEQELELRYKDRHIYAVGHGASVNWEVDEGGSVKEIRSEFFPAVEVPHVTARFGTNDNPVLRIARLASGDDDIDISDAVLKDLDDFVAAYSDWISSQEKLAESLSSDELPVGKRITERMDIASRRMRDGVSLLRSDPLAAQAFRLANQAMLDQMRQADITHDKSRDIDIDTYRWRPFQLGFLLMVLKSAIQEDDDFRDVVDLIWFPTGGGKTEAYLALIAFLIVWRRLKFASSGGGTTVIMRYTLRLLTVQQFLRAARMICALEIIRRKDSRLGVDSITVGMWVGKATSPNKFEDAMGYVRQASEGTTSAMHRLVLNECPWCGSAFHAPKSYISSQSKFHFRCTNAKCAFHEFEHLPCNVVDEAIYDQPPTLLMATVDKFARFTWDERSGSFFGVGANRPPELIIQDELHLITGPLGSIAGVYEAALDTILIRRGIHPKYIAATATIRMARQQVKRLYGRGLNIFPAPGISCDDSYFARTIPLNKHPGRLYIGYMAPMRHRQNCMAPLAAALLLAPEAVFRDGEENRDDLLEAWWSMVIYHGSLKGVGNSHNAFSLDVRDFVQRLTDEINQQEENKLEGDDEDTNPKALINRGDPRIEQLTSLSSAEENARTFSRLERTHNEEDCLDAVLATNMVSVGLDVSRLALMIINGQPLTTAEYIQASSRVGRSDVPGLVFVNYYKDQARSLSHYEDFRPYHESFYRFVEPSSVTPYTYPSRKRALHAALVIAIRYSCKILLKNNQAGEFEPNQEIVKKVVDTLKIRCTKADPEHKKETEDHIDRLVMEWSQEVKFCKQQRIQLVYKVPYNDKSARPLLCNHDDKIKGLWVTLQSMRNVENPALLKAFVSKKYLYLPVRLSHLLRHCSVGSIVRGPEYLMTVQDTRKWTEYNGEPIGKKILYVDQVRSALKIEQELREPPIAKQQENGLIEGECVPAIRFPVWMRCPGCGLLHFNPWKGLKSDEAPRCLNTRKNKNGANECMQRPVLEQVPWVMAHLEGYLADVPWHFLAHTEATTPDQKQCRMDWREPYLYLSDKGSSNRSVRCSRCHTTGSFPASLRLPFGKTKRQPWLLSDESSEVPKDLAEILGVNDARVYSPVTSSALVIPPESRISKGSVVDRLYSSTQKRQKIDRARSPLARKAVIKGMSSDLRCSNHDIEEALNKINNGYPLYGQQITQGLLLESEYQALIEEIPDVADDEDFVTTHHSKQWRKMAGVLAVDSEPMKVVQSIQNLIAVDRLKEVMVCKGFSRLGGEPVPPDIVDESSWLPALELYGEGIFFTLDEVILNKWEGNCSLGKRTASFVKRFEETGSNFQPDLVITSRFMLLHTLAHLLIRQLETVAGYPAASLKERIYCTASQKMSMSGILIYVAVPDVVGSLGGLAELAIPERFLPLVSRVFDHAKWCSLDPVCSEHEGQGPSLLNRAACHACSLVPEPSCAYGNVLLDRTYIKGDQSDAIPSFLDCVDLEDHHG